MRYVSSAALAGLGLLIATTAHAQSTGEVVRIGILNDQAGLYADFGGRTSVDAARMAAEDFGGTVLGKRIEIVVERSPEQTRCGLRYRTSLVRS